MFLGKTQLDQLVIELNLNSIQFNVKEIIEDIEKNGIKSNHLDFTDVDNQQLCIKLSDDVFIYSQQNKFFYNWATDNDIDVAEYYTETYDLSQISNEDLLDGISGFYSSIGAIKKDVSENWKQIAIECYFENEAMGY